ncbi:MAG TPA: FtsX-like permease family protein [Gammaproteobacteria bacterium]|nr:FtsX-like permease family protein [Gammaproteobacteria bacterium]
MNTPKRDRVPLSLALRLLVRDWRSGEIVVLLAALIVAVGAMSAVVFFTDRVRQAVSQQAGEALAADLRLESDQPLAGSFRDDAHAAGLDVVEVIHFNSVVLAGDASALVDVRGVSEGYPLRGELRVAAGLAGQPAPTDRIPAPGQVWAEPALLARLGLDVGDEIEVGQLRLLVDRTLEFRPDEGWRLMEVAPTILLNLADIAASGLLQPGSIAEYEFLFAGLPDDVTRFRAELEPELTASHELRDARNGRPEVRTALVRAEQFLVLAAMVSVLLGGVAVAIAARRFVARRLDGVALMKCIGARYRDILRLNLAQLAMLVVIAGAVGSALGFTAQFGLTWLLADFIEADLPRPGMTGVYIGPVTALVVAVGFALPPLLALGRVPPMRVLRQDLEPPPARFLTIYAVAALALGGLLLALFEDLELVLYVMGGVAVTLGVLYLAGSLLVASLQRLRGRVGIAWRYGIANVARRGRESSVQVSAFGLGLMALLLLGILRTELMTEWQELLPEESANQFLINIQPGEPEAIGDMLAASGFDRPTFTPLLRARISGINGEPLEDYPAPSRWARNQLEDEINLTWLAELADDNEIVAGELWQEDDAAPQLSIEQSLAESTGLGLGDTVTFSVGGETLTVTITSLRSVQWDTFRPNFFMVLNPGIASQYPHTYLSSFYVPPEDRAIMLDLARRFPAVSAIDIGAVLDQVRRAMSRATMAVQYVFLFTLLAGVMVLLAAIQASRDERLFESAVLRTLGARRDTVLKGLAAEFIAIGLLAGIIAAAGAAGLAYFVASRVFELDYVPGIGVLAIGLVAGGLIVGTCGTLAVRSVVNSPPAASLRAA